jgi:hypothetical protein
MGSRKLPCTGPSRCTPRPAVHRGDRGTPHVLPQDQLECYCELIAAMKLRTANKQGRHLSTAETIRLLEDYGVETPDGFVRVRDRRLWQNHDLAPSP